MIAFLFSTSCSHFKAITQPDIKYSADFYLNNLNKEDMVKIVTEDGRDLKFKIIDIDTVAIIGEYYNYDHNQGRSIRSTFEVPFSEITRLEKTYISTVRTVGLVAGILVVLGIGLNWFFTPP